MGSLAQGDRAGQRKGVSIAKTGSADPRNLADTTLVLEDVADGIDSTQGNSCRIPRGINGAFQLFQVTDLEEITMSNQPNPVSPGAPSTARWHYPTTRTPDDSFYRDYREERGVLFATAGVTRIGVKGASH